VTADFRISDVQALVNAAATFEAQAEQLAVEIEVWSQFSIHSVQTGADDLDSLIGSKLDEIVEAMAGEGQRLRQTSRNLAIVAQRYRSMDSAAARSIDAIHW
jgi:hypothetical protein